MSIGLDFVLRGNSASFTKAVAAANNSVKDLKKGLRDFDVGNGFKNALGVGGVIAAFRMAITNAQELRDEADKIGKSIDRGTRSVAELGDAVGRIGKGFKNALTDGLSFFTSIGDKARQFFQNVTQEQEDAARKMVAVTGKAADEAEARLKKSREENSPEKQAEAQAKLDKATREGMAKGTEAQKKLINLVNERADLEERLAKVGPQTVAAKEILADIAKNEMDTKEAAAAFDKEAADAKKKKREEFQKEVVDKFAPSVDQLAQMETGGFVEQNDPRLVARRIKEKERLAAEAGGRGDIKGALRLGTEAENLKKSLEGVTGKGTALTAETAETALRNALDTTNKELVAVKEAVAGIIKAQK